jgi:hypothetical protein
MKAAVLTAFLLVMGCLQASAKTVDVATFRGNNESDVYNYSFSFNGNNLGRAWVEATVFEGAGENSSAGLERFLVNGLHYDTSSDQILFNSTVCAVLEPTFLHLGKYVHQTGNCVVKIRTEERLYDNGFEKVRQIYDIITMTVR